MAKKKLIVEFDLDFILLAISCHEKDYRLCWYLNRDMRMQLARQNDYELHQKRGMSHHVWYTWTDELKRLRYSLLTNRGENGWMAEEQKSADFFLVIEGSLEVADTEEILNGLKQIEIVQTAFEIQVSNFKSATNFLLG